MVANSTDNNSATAILDQYITVSGFQEVVKILGTETMTQFGLDLIENLSIEPSEIELINTIFDH